MEQRWSVRRFLGGEVIVSHPRYGLIHATLRDICLGGMFVETVRRGELPPNMPVVVSFELQNGSRTSHHRLHAMVVRTADDGAALMYLDVSADVIRPLRQMLYGPPAGGAALRVVTPDWLGGKGPSSAAPSST